MKRTRVTRFGRFLIVGFSSVAIDAAVYWLLLALGCPSWTAKPISYVAGTIFSYFGNWRFTFGERRGKFSEVAFALVYASSLAINLGLNELGLQLLHDWSFRAPVVFLFTTAVTTVWNFVGMSLFVFRDREQPVTVEVDETTEQEIP